MIRGRFVSLLCLTLTFGCDPSEISDGDENGNGNGNGVGAVPVEVLITGLSTNPSVVTVALSAGTYTFTASGSITDGVTTFDIEVTEATVSVASVTATLDTVDVTGARVGESCSGSTETTIGSSGAQMVTINMTCGGDAPDAEAVIGFTFCNNPDVTAFSLVPAAPWTPGTSVDVSVTVDDREPGAPIDSVTASFVGASAVVNLSSSSASVFAGQITAPANTGTYDLELTVTDEDCGSTTATVMSLEVVP